jgi:hypothetical protein
MISVLNIIEFGVYLRQSNCVEWAIEYMGLEINDQFTGNS